MKAVILAGGLGTRISEESHLRPKPMVEIGGMPILWHVMKIYAHHGIADFVVCLGYKGYIIKEYFSNYFLHSSDVTIDARENRITFHETKAEPWRVTSGGHRREDADGRPVEASRQLSRPWRALLLHLWRWRRGHRHRCVGQVPSRPRPQSHSYRRGATRTLRRR